MPMELDPDKVCQAKLSQYLRQEHEVANFIRQAQEDKAQGKARQEICCGHKNFAKKYWPTLLAAKLKRDLQSESTRVSLSVSLKQL